MSGLMRESSSRLSDLEVAGESGAHAVLLAVEDHVSELGLGHEVEEVAAVFGEGVDEPTIALAFLGEPDHVVGFEAVVEGVVGEEGAY